MKHKTWFRLVIRAIGVLLLGIAVPALITHVATLVAFVGMYPSMGGGMSGWNFQIWYYIAGPAGTLLQGAFGLYLFFGGKWIVDKAIPSNHPYCPECGYDLSSAGGAVCPECGTARPAG